MYNVLVSGASGIVGYGIAKCLRRCRCRVIGTTIYDFSPADRFCDKVLIAPLTSSSSYTQWLLDVIDEEEIDMIVPGIVDDMERWDRDREMIGERGVRMVLNDSELIKLSLDKWRFYEVLRERGASCRIETALHIEDIDFEPPFVIKPRRGFGSRGVMRIGSIDELRRYERQIGDELMIQPYIGTEGEEYTVGAFYDDDSRLRASIALKRTLSKQGFTETARTADVSPFLCIMEELADIFRPTGPTNLQFRKSEQGIKLLEINPRISSSASIRAEFGYDECRMCVDHYLDGREIEPPAIRHGAAVRYMEDHIRYDSADL